MSTHVVVIASDLRRATVKVSPGTYMVDVLEEACKKLSLGSDKYLLKHQTSTISLSDPFRLTRLSGGSKLELVQKSNTPAVVSVALKLPESVAQGIPNGRLTDKLRSDTTLWKVLRHFETSTTQGGRALNLTARAVPQTQDGAASGSGQLYYEMPVLRVLGREVATLQVFQKTLSQLGINSGSVLLQLEFSRTEKTLQSAMVEIQHFFKEEDDTRQGNTEAGSQSKHSAPVPAEPSAKPTGTVSSPVSEPRPAADLSTPGQSTNEALPASSTSSLQPVGVFSAPITPVPAAAATQDAESVFVPTLAHAQLHQQRLQGSSLNKRLRSDVEIEAARVAQEAKLAAVKSLDIKVRFPDQTSAQWTLGSDATGATLYSAVRGVMANPTVAFRLVLPGGKMSVEDEDGAKQQLIRRYQMVGRVLLTVVWEESVHESARQQPFLKTTFANQAKELEIHPIPNAEDEGVADQPRIVAKPDGRDKSNDGGVKKIPKWLKLPGKK